MRPIILLISGNSQNQLFLSLETPGYLNEFKKKSKIISKTLFWDVSKCWKIRFEIFGKDGHRLITKIRFKNRENLEYQSNKKTRNGNVVVIWDLSFQTTTINHCLFVDPRSFDTLELGAWKPRNQEPLKPRTKKTRNFENLFFFN